MNSISMRARLMALLLAGCAVPLAAAEARQRNHPQPKSNAPISWAANVTILARDCDAFTPTWAPDDQLYTGYGDCSGLNGQLQPKRSMGFGRIGGSPAANSVTVADLDTGAPGAPDVDLSGPTGGLDGFGDGRQGRKPASMLAVGGTLYAWIRNITLNGQSQLKVSGNYAQAGSSWTWASWTLTEFGYPVFVQGGRGYAGQAYAYIVAADSPSAYVPASRFVLMRVPADRVLDQTAYEFFSGSPNAPSWVSFANRAARTAILTDPGHCLRNGVSYNPARGRYYWWQQIPNGSGTTVGFSVLSATQLWGPWTRLYSTTSWDMAPGERGSFPTKWMGGEPITQPGTMYLAFSGGDRLSIRRATVAPGY